MTIKFIHTHYNSEVTFLGKFRVGGHFSFICVAQNHNKVHLNVVYIIRSRLWRIIEKIQHSSDSSVLNH